MNKASILKSMQPKVKAITLGEENAFLSQWSLGAADKVIEAQKKYADDEIDCNEFFAVVCMCSICDESGTLIFKDEDLPDLIKSSAVILKSVYRQAMEFNSVKLEDTEETEKN